MNVTREETYAQIARRIREIPLDKAGSSHEWEELVQWMCDSEDTELRNIGHREHDALPASAC